MRRDRKTIKKRKLRRMERTKRIRIGSVIGRKEGKGEG
jgi:hypothetical protein